MKEHTPPRLPSFEERLRWLLDEWWGGNQRRMASELGLSTSMVSKVLAGERQAGRQFFHAIIEKRPTNLNWLLTGQGEHTMEHAASADRMLPIATCVLPGPPADSQSVLAGRFAAIEPSSYRPTRYWLDVPERSPITRSREAMVREGDLLLFETDVEWMRQFFAEVDDLHSRFLAVALDTEYGRQVKLVEAVADKVVTGKRGPIRFVDHGTQEITINPPYALSLPSPADPPKPDLALQTATGHVLLVVEIKASKTAKANWVAIVGVCIELRRKM